jgi:hypothetical protein
MYIYLQGKPQTRPHMRDIVTNIAVMLAEDRSSVLIAEVVPGYPVWHEEDQEDEILQVPECGESLKDMVPLAYVTDFPTPADINKYRLPLDENVIQKLLKHMTVDLKP